MARQAEFRCWKCGEESKVNRKFQECPNCGTLVNTKVNNI